MHSAISNQILILSACACPCAWVVFFVSVSFFKPDLDMTACALQNSFQFSLFTEIISSEARVRQEHNLKITKRRADERISKQQKKLECDVMQIHLVPQCAGAGAQPSHDLDLSGICVVAGLWNGTLLFFKKNMYNII